MLLYVGNINRQLHRYDMSTFIAKIQGCFVVYEVFDTILTSRTGGAYVSHVFFYDYENILIKCISSRSAE